MMRGKTLPMRVRLPDPALRADLRDFLHRWGFVTYEVSGGAIEVIVPDAPAERQGAANSTSTSRPGEHITQVSNWSSSTDPGDSCTIVFGCSCTQPQAAPASLLPCPRSTTSRLHLVKTAATLSRR